MKTKIDQVKAGFDSLTVSAQYKEKALKNLERWLTDEQLQAYVPQINHLIDQAEWDYLLDSFYQVIPFGTGGRRGEVGIGPNRINPWTIQASAQGHAQFLLKNYGQAAQDRGVVFAYDVRQFTATDKFDPNLPNPVDQISSRDFAYAAAEVYAANGIKVLLFDDIRTTPQLSFSVRQLNAVAGAVFSASHNPPNHNGKKVYDEFGGQLIPPHDEALVEEVTERVTEINTIPFDQAQHQDLIQFLGPEIDQQYLEAAGAISLSGERDISIIYTPLHGCGHTSVAKVLTNLGFTFHTDPSTANPSGRFENVTFNIPNPEVIQSFDTTLKYAQEKQADIILNSDPDADRIGIMVKHQSDWQFIDGNQIAIILTNYVISKRQAQFTGQESIIKTIVTTDLIKRISQRNNVKLYGDLLIGFKYVGDIMNSLEAEGTIDHFLVGIEESHGYLAGQYARDKDAVTAAVWLAELAAELKKDKLTLIDYLNQIYNEYGFFRNYLTEIRMLGASGKAKIDAIQASLRTNPPSSFGPFKVIDHQDFQDHQPILSQTDWIAKDVLVFKLSQNVEGQSIKVTVRPSGTEPKIKMYFEIGAPTGEPHQLEQIKQQTEELLVELEKAVMKYCYQTIGIDFPDRGFLLFWQLPLDDKLKYFTIEEELAGLRDKPELTQRRQQMNHLLSFLGSNPIQKVDAAFQSKYGQPIEKYLKLDQE